LRCSEKVEGYGVNSDLANLDLKKAIAYPKNQSNSDHRIIHTNQRNDYLMLSKSEIYTL